MDAMTVAMDLAKDVFEVAVANRAGRIVERKRLTRRQFERFIDALSGRDDGGDGGLWRRRTTGADDAWRTGSRCGCCRPSMCARTSVAIRQIGRTRKRCSRPIGVAESSRCRSRRSSSKRSKRCIASGRNGKRRGPRASMSMRGVLREYGLPIAVGARTVLTRIPALLDDATT